MITVCVINMVRPGLWSLFLIVWMIGGCQNSRVQVNTQDTTVPVLKPGSVNLVPEFAEGQGQSSPTNPSQIEFVASLPEAQQEGLVSATALDNESGIRTARVTGELRVWCISSWGDSNPATLATRRIEGSEVASTPNAQGTLPQQVLTTLTVSRSMITAGCPGQTVSDYEVVATASATNGAGLSSQSAPLRIVRPVSIIAANVWAPCLRELEAAGNVDLGTATRCDGLYTQPAVTGPRPSHLNGQLDRWGRYFNTEDIILISELDVADVRWLDRIRQSAPSHFVAHSGMTVILSRWPLSNITNARSAPTCFPPQYLCLSQIFSEYVRASVDTPRGPMDVFSVHWAHRPSPVESSPERIAFAERSRDTVRAAPVGRWIVMGGDFNSKSVWMASPDELEVGDEADNKRQFADLHGRSQPEIAAIEGVMRNARREVFETGRDRWTHDFGWPIDFVWLHGPLNAVSYTNQTGQYGSDHAWIRVDVMRR